MSTLYRKYRPQNFKEVVGQNHIKTTLTHEIESGRIAHAYLFTGPRAVGKTTLARVFAKAVNCRARKEGEHEPCGKCEQCVSITAGKNLDIAEMDAASHTGVDNVRENIISSARVSPSGAKYKVFIIDEVHMLSVSAFNALLKIMEEPPEFVIFILCTTEAHKVPTTIISRCQRFDFKKISIRDITDKLSHIIKSEGMEADREILESIARRSEGHMRDAESILGQITAIGGKKITAEEAALVIPRSDTGEIINLINFLADKNAAAGIGLINNLVNDGVDLKVFAGNFTEVVRKILLGKISPGLEEKYGLELGESLELKLAEAGGKMELARLVLILDKFKDIKEDIKKSFITQLPLELAIISVCSGASAPPAAKPSVSSAKPDAPAKLAPEPPAKESASKPSEPASSAATPANISLEQIKAKWSEVLAVIKKHNHSLSFVLRVCEPRSISGSTLELVFKYKFHKERISDPAIGLIVENALKEIYGEDLKIQAALDETLDTSVDAMPVSETAPPAEDEQPGQPGGGVIDSLLKNFGGKIVS